MLRRTFLLGAALALTGCAATGPVSKGALSSSYAEGSVTSVVVLPLLYSSRVAAYQPTVQFELAAALQEKNPKLRFMATNEALTRLSTGDGVLASRDLSYAVFNKQEVKAEDLKKVQTVLGVDAAMIGGYVDAEGNRVEMPLSIIDLRNGKIIWTGVSAGWFKASVTDKRFSSDLDITMKEGLSKLHSMMPKFFELDSANLCIISNQTNVCSEEHQPRESRPGSFRAVSGSCAVGTIRSATRTGHDGIQPGQIGDEVRSVA